MRLELYQAETARIAAEQSAILQSARNIIFSGRALTALEQGGVLHALQIIIENAIGKEGQTLYQGARASGSRFRLWNIQVAG